MAANISDQTAPALNRRLFSLARANRSLPQVRRIVADICQASQKVADYHEQLERLVEQGDSQRSQQSMLDLHNAGQQYRKFNRELEQLGCSLSDGLAGAVDFPAVVRGKEVVLCWRLGESAISRWRYPGWQA